MAGRPSEYDPDIAAKICELVEEGSGLKKACAAVGKPFRTFYNWLDNHPELVAAYERACANRADDEVDQIKDILAELDPTVENAAAHINLARLKIDSIKWTAGKHRPKKYNDKLIVTGGDGIGPLQVVIQKFTDGKSE